jgi:biopolymer transport protein ExbD
MRRNFAMRKLERRHRKPSELLLVPMIDIFTVLVTFVEPPPGMQLEVLVRQDMIQVADAKSGPLASFPRSDRKLPYDLAGLSAYLQQVKARFPDMTDGTLLLEPDIPYDWLVQVMDTMRLVEQRQGALLVQAELFPNVSIGDAPVTDAPGARP